MFTGAIAIVYSIVLNFHFLILYGLYMVYIFCNWRTYHVWFQSHLVRIILLPSVWCKLTMSQVHLKEPVFCCGWCSVPMC